MHQYPAEDRPSDSEPDFQLLAEQGEADEAHFNTSVIPKTLGDWVILLACLGMIAGTAWLFCSIAYDKMGV